MKPAKQSSLKEFKVPDFPLLCHLWAAGNGEFFFRNFRNNRQLCIKMHTYMYARPNRYPHTIIWVAVIERDFSEPYTNLIPYKRCLVINHITKQHFIDSLETLSSDLYKYFSNIHSFIERAQHLPTHIEAWYAGKCCRCGCTLKLHSDVQKGFCVTCSAKVAKVIQLKLM